MSRPRMTKNVRKGLRWLVTFGEAFLEADCWETPVGIEEESGEPVRRYIEAAQRFVAAGGLQPKEKAKPAENTT